MDAFKQSVDKANPKTASQLQDAVTEFLDKYRSTPYTVTSSSPSELLVVNYSRLVIYILAKLILPKLKNNGRVLMTVTLHHINLLRVIQYGL